MLDDKSKRRYKVKINIIEGYDPYQVRKEELSGNISKFPPVANSDIVNYFLFSLSLLIEEELKAYKKVWSSAIRSYQDGSRKQKQNCLEKLPWLLDESVPNLFPSSCFFSILISSIVFIALAKIPEREGSILSSSFYRQLPDCWSHVLALST